jgi:hypothetical protein
VAVVRQALAAAAEEEVVYESNLLTHCVHEHLCHSTAQRPAEEQV